MDGNRHMVVVAIFLLVLAATCVPFVTAQGGNAFFLDGIDDHIELVMPEVTLYGDWTLEYWHLPASRGGNWVLEGHDCLMDTVLFDSQHWVNWRSWFFQSNEFVVITPYVLDQDNLVSTHFALTHSSANQSFDLFVNGELFQHVEAPTPDFPEHRTNNLARFAIGRCALEANGVVTWERHLQGYVDELRFWNSTLSGPEIRANMYSANPDDLCCPLIRVNGEGVVASDAAVTISMGDLPPLKALLGGGLQEHQPSLVPSPFEALQGGPVALSLIVGLAAAVDLRLPELFTWVRVEALPAGVGVINGAAEGAAASNAIGVVLRASDMWLVAEATFETVEVVLIACQTEAACGAASLTDPSAEIIIRRVRVQAQANSAPSAGTLFEIQLLGNGGYMELPKIEATGTVEFWLKMNVFNRHQAVWCTHDAGGGNYWMLFLHGGQQRLYHGFRSWNNAYVRGYFQDGEPLLTPRGERQHVAVTWWTVGPRPDIWCQEWSETTPCQSNGTALGWEVWEVVILTYKNGVRIPTDPALLTSNGTWLFRGSFSDPTLRPNTIGQEWDGDTASDYLDGEVAEIRVWDHVRSQEEIAANYQRQLVGAEPGLKLYIRPTETDFAVVPAGGSTEYRLSDMVAQAQWTALMESQELRDCNMAAREIVGDGILRCTLTLAECSFDQTKGFIVRRSRFSEVMAEPLVWRVQEMTASATLPIPRQDADSMNDFFVTERPDLLPADTAVQDRLTSLVSSTTARAHIRLEGSSCGSFQVGNSSISFSPGVAITLEVDENLLFEPFALGETTGCHFRLIYDAADSSGVQSLAGGTVEVEVLPAAPELVQVLAVDNKPANRDGLQIEDELHLIFDKPTNIPTVTSIAELRELFDVNPPEAIPDNGLFIGCWTGDSKRLVLSIQDPAEAWSGTANASFTLRQGMLTGRAWSTVASGRGNHVRAEGDFAIRPCSGGGEVLDGLSGTCIQCDTGARLADSGQLCVPCASGKVSESAGSLSCTDCGFGEYQPASGTSECMQCEAGKFAASTGSTSCNGCPEGFYAGTAGSSICLECPIGTFAAELAVSGCMLCSDVEERSAGANPHAWVTMERLQREGFEPEWVYLFGATNATQCGCDRGFVEFNGGCEKCGEGLSCAGMGEVLVEEGYYVPENSISVYHCFGRTEECTGGAPGATCAEGRISLACADCIDGLAPGGDGKCVDCAGTDLGVPIGLGFVGLLVLVFLYRQLSSTKRALQGQSFLLASICFSHICTLAQQLSVISLMNVEFGAPFKDMQGIFQVALFDFNILGLDCLSTTTATARYNMSLFAVVAVLCVVVLIHFVFCGVLHRCRLWEQLPVLVCVLGTLLLAFYISLVAAILQPFQCFEHPNGKWTPRSYQSVICFESNEHTSMVVSSCIGMIIPCVFLATCAWAVVHTPFAVRRGEARFLRSFGFLLFRFRTSAREYSLFVLTRAMILACAPVLPEISIQLMVFNFTLLASLVVVLYVRPWRVAAADFFEIAVTVALLVVVNLAGMLVDDHNRLLLSTLCLLLVMAGFILALLGLLLGLIRWCRPGKKTYQFFLSHHKVGAGATARMMKLSLLEAKEVTRKVFYDSDDLMNLDGLFNTVGQEVDTMILIGSREVLTRPWCLGELTIARMKKLHATLVAHPDYEFPQDSEVRKFLENSTELECLFEYEINLESIHETITWVSTFPQVRVQEKTVDAFHVAARACLDLQAGKTNARASQKAQKQPQAQSSFIITADAHNREAVITGLVLLKYIMAGSEVGMDLSSKPVLSVNAEEASCVFKCKQLVVLCSAKALSNSGLVSHVVGAFMKDVICVPAVIDDTFVFPQKEDLDSIQANAATLLSKPIQQDLSSRWDVVSLALMSLFKAIAVPFPYMASQSILTLRAQEIYQRATTTTQRGGGYYQNMKGSQNSTDDRMKAIGSHPSAASGGAKPGVSGTDPDKAFPDHAKSTQDASREAHLKQLQREDEELRWHEWV